MNLGLLIMYPLQINFTACLLNKAGSDKDERTAKPKSFNDRNILK